MRAGPPHSSLSSEQRSLSAYRSSLLISGFVNSQTLLKHCVARVMSPVEAASSWRRFRRQGCRKRDVKLKFVPTARARQEFMQLNVKEIRVARCAAALCVSDCQQVNVRFSKGKDAGRGSQA